MSEVLCHWPADTHSPASLLQWHVTAGAEVNVGDAVLSVQTPAGSSVWPAPAAGRITRLLIAPGQDLNAGSAVFAFIAVSTQTALPRHRHTEARLQQALARRQRHRHSDAV